MFCKHIYRLKGYEYSYTTTINEGSIILPAYYDTVVDVYIAIYECVKCGKKKAKEIYVKKE